MTSLSIIVPVYNSAESLPILVERLEAAMKGVADAYELILVNDASRDASWEVVRRLADERPWIRGICLMRNFGQHNALLCGIRAAKYETIVTMDDDLQHPPEEIGKLLEALDRGFDVVYGVPRALPHQLWRNVLSRFTKGLLAWTMGIRNIRDISAFRAFRTGLRDAFAGFQGPHLLLDALLSWGAMRYEAVVVRHDPRTIGQSNYTFGKLLNQSLLILVGFSTAPLRFASIVGFAFTLFGLLVLAYVLAVAVIRQSVPGFPFLASLVAVFSGAQLFALGIMGEYLARIFNRSLDRPTYVVQNVVGGDS